MMGLSYEGLYELTPRSFNNKIKGFSEHHTKSNQDSWERTRTIMIACLMPHSKKKLRPTDVLPFPWDNKNKPKKEIASKEHIQKVLERYRKSNFNKL